MTVELNIYNKNQIIKTYKSDCQTLETGICLDLLKDIDFDLWFEGDDETKGKIILKSILKNFKQIKIIFQDLFPELTDEEFEKTKINEITQNILKIATYTAEQLFVLSDKSKN